MEDKTYSKQRRAGQDGSAGTPGSNSTTGGADNGGGTGGIGEETTMRGAYWAASKVRPNVAIAVDVTYAQDYPGTDPAESGDVKLGGGPVICNGSMASRKVNALLKSCARENAIPYQVESFPGRTGTDADKMHQAGEGVVTALLSLPLRYMHSPGEVCQISDIEHAVNLLAAFLCAVGEGTDFDPFTE